VLASPTLPGAGLPAEDLLTDVSPRTRWRIGFDRVAGWLLPLLFGVAILPILDVVYYISVRALPTLSFAVLTSTSLTGGVDELGVPLVSTFEIMALATSVAVLLGLFGGVATAEFLSERTAGWVRTSANMLAGTPSVVMGYFGYFAFVLYFGWGYTLISGAFTLAFFMTPYVFRTADLAFSSVPRHVREAAFGSGAGPLQYILRIGTPIAFPQILTGVFLAMAIGVGETAPVVLTTAVSTLIPPSVFSPATFMTELIWANFNSPLGAGYIDVAFQAAFILVVVVMSLNIVVRLISARYQKKLEGLYA
jgi:phosphate transport system permease protein